MIDNSDHRTEHRRKRSLICALLVRLIPISLILTIIQVVPVQYASASAQSELDEATARVQQANSDYDSAVNALNESQKKLDDTNNKITELEEALPQKEENARIAVKSMYENRREQNKILNAILTGTSLSELMSEFDSMNRIAEWNSDALSDANDARNELEETKLEQESEKSDLENRVNEAKQSKISALDAREEARKKVYSINSNTSSSASSSGTLSGTNDRASTDTSSSDSEASARAWIVKRESGGNYNARNGKYIGAYQLTSSYLGGDYSPAHQDAVADSYVKRRYGSWVGAKNFWMSHGWY